MVYCSVTCAESEGEKEETVEQSEQSQQEMSQVRVSATEYPIIVINERTCTTHIFYTFSAHTMHWSHLKMILNTLKIL